MMNEAAGLQTEHVYLRRVESSSGALCLVHFLVLFYFWITVVSYY